MKTALILAFVISCLSACPDTYCRQCTFVDPNPVCNWCQYSYLDVATKDCVVPNEKIDNCLSYTSDGAHPCKACDIGYTLVDGKCLPCPDNCSTCKPDQKTCTTCFKSIRPTNGLCDTDQKCVQ